MASRPVDESGDEPGDDHRRRDGDERSAMEQPLGDAQAHHHDERHELRRGDRVHGGDEAGVAGLLPAGDGALGPPHVDRAEEGLHAEGREQRHGQHRQAEVPLPLPDVLDAHASPPPDAIAAAVRIAAPSSSA